MNWLASNCAALVAGRALQRTAHGAFSASETFDVGDDLGSTCRSTTSTGVRSASTARSRKSRSSSTEVVLKK